MTKSAVVGQKEFLAGWGAFKSAQQSGRPKLEPPPAPAPKTPPTGRTKKGLQTRKAKHGKTKLKKGTVEKMKKRGDKVEE